MENESPLVRWDGLHLAVDLDRLLRQVDRFLGGVEQVSGVTLAGEGGAVKVGATITWKGLCSRVAVDLSEIRLKNRFLGLRFHKPRVLGGMRVPRAAVEAILSNLGLDGVTVFRGQGIVVMDLRQWLAPELDLSVLTVQTTGRSLHVWLGPGELRDLPAPQPRALPEGSASTETNTLESGPSAPR
jgi:hypothetical protein